MLVRALIMSCYKVGVTDCRSPSRTTAPGAD